MKNFDTLLNAKPPILLSTLIEVSWLLMDPSVWMPVDFARSSLRAACGLLNHVPFWKFWTALPISWLNAIASEARLTALVVMEGCRRIDRPTLLAAPRTRELRVGLVDRFLAWKVALWAG